MSRIRVKGFKIFKDRHGKLRCYHRATGHKIDVEKHPLGTAGFFAECEKIRVLVEALDARKAKPGTLGGLIEFYFQTDHFASLSTRTKADYRKQADFLAPILDTPSYSLNTPLIAGIHDKAAKKRGWRQANMLRSFLSEVFRFALPAGLVQANFATDVMPKQRPKGRPRANRPWSIEELAFVLDNAPPQIAAAVALIANTGLDPSDALRLRRDAVSNGVIWADRGKTGVPVAIPVLERLQLALNRSPSHDAITVLASTKGQPWTYNGFSTVWHRWRAQQAVDGHMSVDLTLKGLRHTLATILREAGTDLRSIADVLGQKTESMANWYSRDAQLAERNRETMAIYDQEIERRTKIVKPNR